MIYEGLGGGGGGDVPALFRAMSHLKQNEIDDLLIIMHIISKASMNINN